MEDFENNQSCALYDNLSVGSESSGYILSVSDYSGDAGNVSERSGYILSIGHYSGDASKLFI